MRAIIVQNLSLKFILNVEKNCNYLYITPNWIVRWCKPSQAFVMRVKQSELFLMEIDTIAYGQGQTAHGEPWHALEIKPGRAGDHHTCQQKTSLIVSILSSTTFSNNPSTYTHSKLHAYIRWLYLKIYLLNDAPQSLDEPGTKKLRSFYAASMLRRHACQIVHSLTEKTEELSDYTGEKKKSCLTCWKYYSQCGWSCCCMLGSTAAENPMPGTSVMAASSLPYCGLWCDIRITTQHCAGRVKPYAPVNKMCLKSLGLLMRHV